MQSVWVPLLLSLKVALWATFFSTLVGVGLAYALARWQGGWANLIDSLLTLPMVLPPTVIGYYLLVLFAGRGCLGRWWPGWGLRRVFPCKGAVGGAGVGQFPWFLSQSAAPLEGVIS